MERDDLWKGYDFSGRTVVMTGGTGVLGSEMAAALVRAGANVAILAREHGIPFYVAAPRTTFDFSIPDGSGIPIEERDPAEVTHGFGVATAPAGVKVFSPAFDVTPARYVTGFFTDAGLLTPPFETSLQVLRQPLGPEER